MTDEQMNMFLESIGGLDNGYYSNRPPITSCGFFECGNGWFPLIKDLIVDLIELEWDKQICQVKEKFGGLRFYINDGSDEIHKRIMRTEEESYKICEITGDVGELRTDIGWYRTLCEDEYLKIKNKRNG